MNGSTEQEILAKLSKALETSRKELADYKEAADSQIAKIESDFRESMEAAERAFSADVANKAPVELWTLKQSEHETMRDGAFSRFVGGLAAVALACLGIMGFLTFFSDLANTLLAPVGCDTTKPETCKGISLRGMIATASVLTALTVLLWFTRLQMKLYLAERHLVLDARERRAFAQTYVGLLAEGDTSKEASEQRALVYTALFRPSSDGTIKDDGGLDPAVTAALSKFLSK